MPRNSYNSAGVIDSIKLGKIFLRFFACIKALFLVNEWVVRTRNGFKG